jgi:hypothetical protein
MYISGSNTRTLQKTVGLNTGATNDGSGNVGTVASIIGWATHRGSGNASYTYGGYMGAEALGGTNTELAGIYSDTYASGSTVTDWYGIKIDMAKSAGTVTNRYALYLGNPSGTTTSDDFGIYQSGLQPNSFGGQIYSRSNLEATNTVDWNKGNIQYTNNSCGAFTFNNIKDGGSYTFVVKGGTAATCSFTGGGLTYKWVTASANTVAGKHTVYTFFRAGTDVYISWVTGI